MTEEAHNQEDDVQPTPSLEEVVVREIFDQIQAPEFAEEFLCKLNEGDVQAEDWQKLTDLILTEKADAETAKES